MTRANVRLLVGSGAAGLSVENVLRFSLLCCVALLSWGAPWSLHSLKMPSLSALRLVTAARLGLRARNDLHSIFLRTRL